MLAQADPVTERDHRPGRPSFGWSRYALAAAIGLLFLLPHLVRIQTLGSYAAYSPFSGTAGSAMVWDETFLYGAEANYTLTRHAFAYDDTWEHRADVFPYSVLPVTLEAGLAALLGSLKAAHLLIAFLFPTLTALLLMAIFARLGCGVWMGALLALTTLVLGFSARTLLLDIHSLLLHSHGLRATDALQAIRTPNPGMTFPQYLAALYCAAAALRWRNQPMRSLRWATAGGVLGGLLFLSYIYYAIPWSATIALLAFLSLWRRSTVPRTMLAALATSLVATLPFLWWRHLSIAAGTYAARSNRLGMIAGHALRPEGLRLTLVWGGMAAASLLLWLLLRPRHADPAAGETAWDDPIMLVLLLAMAGGIATLHMQVVTGFAVPSEFHVPHMLLQPLGLLLAGALVATPLRRYGAGKPWLKATAAIAFLALYIAAAAAQFEAARNGARFHRVTPSQQALFAWLAVHSAVGSVIATDDLPLSIELPVMTHNSVLLAEGSRGQSTNDELLERFLLASRLASAPAARVRAELAQDHAWATYAFPKTYTYFLFEVAPIEETTRPRIAAQYLPGIMARYDALPLAEELQRYRLDYLWTRPDESPATVPGLAWQPALQTAEGTLWTCSRLAGAYRDTRGPSY